MVQVKRVAERLIAALEHNNSPDHIVSAAIWEEHDHQASRTALTSNPYPPSAVASSALIPFRPESANPTKVLIDQHWKLYVIDSPSQEVNAFALPTKELFVYTGLIDLLDDDELLAGVLAHEIAHVTQSALVP